MSATTPGLFHTDSPVVRELVPVACQPPTYTADVQRSAPSTDTDRHVLGRVVTHAWSGTFSHLAIF